MENITFDQLPKAVSRLIEMVGQLSDKVEEMIETSTPPQIEHQKILYLSDVAALLGKSTYTVYAMTSDKRIPYHKRGNKLYFFEDEIIQWIKQGESAEPYKEGDFNKRLEELRGEKKRKPASLLSDNANR